MQDMLWGDVLFILLLHLNSRVYTEMYSRCFTICWSLFLPALTSGLVKYSCRKNNAIYCNLFSKITYPSLHTYFFIEIFVHLNMRLITLMKNIVIYIYIYVYIGCARWRNRPKSSVFSFVFTQLLAVIVIKNKTKQNKPFKVFKIKGSVLFIRSVLGVVLKKLFLSAGIAVQRNWCQYCLFTKREQHWPAVCAAGTEPF